MMNALLQKNSGTAFGIRSDAVPFSDKKTPPAARSALAGGEIVPLIVIRKLSGAFHQQERIYPPSMTCTVPVTCAAAGDAR